MVIKGITIILVIRISNSHNDIMINSHSLNHNDIDKIGNLKAMKGREYLRKLSAREA